ncbi:MAG: TonB-dependent receptor [Bacteroidales bacterium]
MKHFAFTLLFFCFTLLPAFSSYTIRGVIKDGQTKEELIGATISIKDESGKGTITGLDGSFILNGITGKSVTLICGYIGYNPTHITVTTNNKPLEIFLNQTAIELNTVEVTANRIHNNEIGARFLEKQAQTVLNIVSARSIEASPDINVSNILQRVSGVTIDKGNSGEGEFAVLRGMDKRYNYTLVNGVKIPSPDNKNRYIPLNIFPGELLDRLEVSKSLTPDMEGDGTGGAINLVMKDAPARTTFQANFSSGYNSELIDHKLASFDKKNLTKHPPRETHGTQYQATTADFKNGSTHITKKQSRPDMLAGFMFGDRFFDNRLGVVIAGSYQNRNKHTESLFFSDVMSQTETTVRLTSVNNRNYSENQMQYGVHGKLDYKITPAHKIEWCNSIVGNEITQVREGITTDLSLNYNPSTGNALENIQTRTRFTKQQIVASTLQGEHQFADKLILDWSGVYSFATNQRPDITYVNLENYRADFQDKITADNSERRWEKNSDHDWTGYMNIKYTLPFVRSNLQLKAGGMYRNKERTNKYTVYRFIPAANTRPVLGIDFNDIHEIEWKVATPKGSVGPLNYDAGENIGAVYLMGNWEHDNWSIIGGIRAEHTSQSYVMEFPSASDEPESSQKYMDYLPSLSVKYKPNEKMNIRSSYFRSINRPGFFEIVPYSIINEEYTEYGNKDLKRAVIDNIDLRWEYFPTNNEQIMVGAFYKHIDNPIEYAYYSPNGRQFGYGPTNLGNATNWGIEADFIKYIRNFGIKANYTYTHSAITTPKTLYQTDENGSLTRLQVEQTRPLVNQAPHVANLSLLYKEVRFNWDFQISGTYTGEKIVIASHFLDSDYWEGGVFSLDLSAEKRFKCGISVFAKANNLLTTATERYIKTTNPYNETFPHQKYKTGKTLIRRDTNGTNLLLGVRYKM